jgi:hypothetical protein
MYIDNPLLQFDFNSLKQGYGQLQGMPSLVGREQTLQQFPQLQDSGFGRQVQPGPVYGLAPQRPNAPLYGEYDAGPGAYMGQESMPGNATPGDFAAISLGMLGGIAPGLAAIAGVVARSQNMDMGVLGDALGVNKRSMISELIDSALGFRAPVSEFDLGQEGLGFGVGPHGGASGYGGDRGGAEAGHGGTAGGADGQGSAGGGPDGSNESGAATGGY